MVRVLLHGPMAVSMLVNSRTGKGMVRVLLHGPMAVSTSADGRTTCSMGLARELIAISGVTRRKGLVSLEMDTFGTAMHITVRMAVLLLPIQRVHDRDRFANHHPKTALSCCRRLSSPTI